MKTERGLPTLSTKADRPQEAQEGREGSAHPPALPVPLPLPLPPEGSGSTGTATRALISRRPPAWEKEPHGGHKKVIRMKRGSKKAALNLWAPSPPQHAGPSP